MITVYHAKNTRSIRVLWTLEELGVKADVKTLPFPPRKHQPGLPVAQRDRHGADDDRRRRAADRVRWRSASTSRPSTSRTSSCAPGDPDRTDFVQWLWYGESTLMTPLSRIATVEPAGAQGRRHRRRAERCARQCRRATSALEQRLEGREFIVGGPADAGRYLRSAIRSTLSACLGLDKPARSTLGRLSRPPARAAGLSARHLGRLRSAISARWPSTSTVR